MKFAGRDERYGMGTNGGGVVETEGILYNADRRKRTDALSRHNRIGAYLMREWTREEKYRYLKDPQELAGLYRRISASAWRQSFHNQPVTGLMNDPNGFVWHDNRWHLFYQ